MRLYRGLKNPYRPERVGDGRFLGSDFTDCPAVALSYAQTSRGMLVVVDIQFDETFGSRRVSSATWPQRDAKRFIIWGRFDDVIVVQLEAKELRARLRAAVGRNALLATKARVLRTMIDDEIRLATRQASSAS